jgi:type IV pilus assembly protein PilM
MAHPTGIGVEISEDQIRVAKLRRTARGVSLQGLGAAPTPSGAMSGGTVLNSRLLADGIRRALRLANIHGASAVVGLPGRAFASRVLELPAMAKEELKSVVAGEMEHYRMIPMDQGTFDFVTLGEPEDSSRRARILVMAADKRMVDDYREGLRLAGMHLAALEPASLAACRAAYPALQTGGVALVTVGARTSEFTVFISGAVRYSRQIDVGGLDIIERGAPEGTALQDMRPALLTTIPTLEQSGGDLQALLYEVQRSLDFYHREAPAADRVERLVLSVDTQRVAGLDQLLQQHLELPVTVCDPLQGVSYSDADFNPELLARIGSAYGPAIGLALRMIEETPRTPCVDLSVTGRESRLAKVAPRWLLWATGLSVLLVMGALLAMLQGNAVLQRREAQLARAKVELAKVSAEEQARTAAAKRVQEAQQIVQIRGLPWSDILFQVSGFMPEGVWLTSLGVESGNTLALEGSALSATSVATMMESLTRSPLFQGPQMSSIQKENIAGQPTTRYQVKVLLTPSAQPETVNPPAVAAVTGGAL